MANYKKNINYIVTLEETQAMITVSKFPHYRFLIALLYLTGARPSEVNKIKREDIEERSHMLYVKIQTLKLRRKRKQFKITDRTLVLNKNMPFFEEIYRFWAASKSIDRPLLPITRERIFQIVDMLSKKKLCPYHFRHSRLTKLARLGASIDQLMYWKGASDTRSVGEYLKGKPISFARIE